MIQEIGPSKIELNVATGTQTGERTIAARTAKAAGATLSIVAFIS
jgi:hypothetical protein